MWKFTKNFPKVFFVRSYESGKFCSKFVLSCFLFVAHVAIVLERCVEVKGICCTNLAGVGKHSANHVSAESLWIGELLLRTGISWHQGMLDVI